MNIAVVTGASSGMGREFARQLDAGETWDEIWLIARRKDRLEELAASLRAKARLLPFDLSGEEGLAALRTLLEEVKPNIRVLVNAAGYGKFGLMCRQTTADKCGMIDLNIIGLVSVTDAALPYMTAGARILQLGSASTYHPVPYLGIYAATKAFVKHYSRALNRELKPEGITVTCVCPGWVRTEFFARAEIDTSPEKTVAKPSVAAEDVVCRALRDAEKGKDLSTYGWYNRLHRAFSRLLPAGWMMNTWVGMVKRAERKK